MIFSNLYDWNDISQDELLNIQKSTFAYIDNQFQQSLLIIISFLTITTDIIFTLTTHNIFFGVSALLYILCLLYNLKLEKKHKRSRFSTYVFMFFQQFVGHPLSKITVDNNTGKFLIENTHFNYARSFKGSSFYLFEQNGHYYMYSSLSFTGKIYMIHPEDIERLSQISKVRFSKLPEAPNTFQMDYAASEVDPVIIYKQLQFRQLVGPVLHFIPVCTVLFTHQIVSICAIVFWVSWYIYMEALKEDLINAFCQTYTNPDSQLFIKTATHFKDILRGKKQRDYLSFYIILAHYYHNINLSDNFIKNTLVIFPGSRPYVDTVMFQQLLNLIKFWKNQDVTALIRAYDDFKNEVTRLNYSKWPPIIITAHISQILICILRKDYAAALEHMDKVSNVYCQHKTIIPYNMPDLINYLYLKKMVNEYNNIDCNILDTLNCLYSQTNIKPII